MDEPPAETERDDELEALKARAPGDNSLQDGESRTDSQTGIKEDPVGLNSGKVSVRQSEKTRPDNERDPLQSQGIETDANEVRLEMTSIILNDHFNLPISSPA